MRVLIAEDETIIRLDVRALLEKAGHQVVAEAREGNPLESELSAPADGKRVSSATLFAPPRSV